MYRWEVYYKGFNKYLINRFDVNYLDMMQEIDMSNIIRVGMADVRVCKAPDRLTTLGLGSCVGIVLYDTNSRVAGMAHIMLPDSTIIRQNSNRAKFADTGIDYLLDLLRREGVKPNTLKAKIAGGAQMFKFSTNDDSLKIGDRNVEAVKEKLNKLNIPIIAEDCGGNYGRTIEFDIETERLIIKAIGKEVSYI